MVEEGEENKEGASGGKQAEIICILGMQIKICWQFERIKKHIKLATEQYKNAKKQRDKDTAISNLEAVARDWTMNGGDIKMSKECMQQIVKNHIQDLGRGGGTQCDIKCIEQGCQKQNRNWAGMRSTKSQNYLEGIAFYSKSKCKHGRQLKIKWFLNKDGQIHSGKDQLEVKEPINVEDFREPSEYQEDKNKDKQEFE